MIASPRTRRGFLALLWIALTVLGASSQQAKEPVLVDEYGITACDNFLGRLDAFLAELRNNPEWRGFIIVYSAPEKRHQGVLFAEMMREHFKWRNWDIKPIEIVRGDSGEELSMQFWRVAPNGTPPKVERPVPSFEIAETVRAPFILTGETKFGAVICPAIDDQKIFASFLRDNPKARGNIVVRERSMAAARRQGNRILRVFEGKFKIPRSRLRVFPALLQHRSTYDEVIVEYWYLP